ncbi:MAG TPA: ParB/RepB/Spo0J family partition protein [Candidatus Polarisedimenticolaceae bacterium]|nr:ParB/RepB/Spo0J family partition protein [Candidatus Polarisedimenticolaceae bacterium]
MKHKALGKGLRSLIPEAPVRSSPPPSPTPAAVEPPLPPSGERLHMLDLDLIRPNPRQPRQDFDETSLEALAGSLKDDGVLQPIVVRPAGSGRFEIVAGERRWRAAQRAGLLKVPAMVRDVPEDRRLELALIENLQREGLNPIEEAQAYRALLDEFGWTQQELATKVGRQRATVANSLRLLGLPRPVQDRVRAGAISMGHARALAAVEDGALQTEIAGRIEKEGLSVRQVEQLVQRRATTKASAAPTPGAGRDPNVVSAEQNLQRALGTRVRIVERAKGGTIEVTYHGHEELMRLYDVFAKAGRVRA